MGDPAGIGVELTVQAWHLRDSAELTPFVVYGSAEVFEARAREIGHPLPVETVPNAGAALALFDDALPVIDMMPALAVVAGVADPANGAAVIASIERAVGDTVTGHTAAIVTNPIAKSVLYEAGFSHPGHTEFLGALANCLVANGPYCPVMMITSEHLRVVPLTIHIPLGEVPRAITREGIVTTVGIIAQALERDFGIARPRIAVTGLNPHAGEKGSMGREETNIIVPALADLAARGLDVTGPHPADTLFHAARRSSYDAVLGMYHDQVLIPAKTLAFDTGVNVTLGLPFVRTSPDHGTAFDIAGKGVASPSSLIAALKLARSMSRTRRLAGALTP